MKKRHFDVLLSIIGSFCILCTIMIASKSFAKERTMECKPSGGCAVSSGASWLEQLLGAPDVLYGDCNGESMNFGGQAGYECICWIKNGPVNPSGYPYPSTICSAA